LILSDRLWRTAFGSDPGILGRQVSLDDGVHTVIGVMPPDFSFPTRDEVVWVAAQLPAAAFEDRNDNTLEVVARLKPGVSLTAANAEMDLIARRLRQQYPKENEHLDARINSLRDEVSQQSRLLLVALSGAAACVLLIVCANTANLLLARALGRRRELAVRSALGGGRERLLRQLATESVSLAAIGGVLGVFVAMLVLPLLSALVPETFPVGHDPAVDVRTLTFALAITALTGIVFGLAPALRASDADPRGLREDARAGGGRKERLRSALVVAEVVASIVLLIASGLMVRAMLAIQARDPGFRTENMLTVRTALPVPRYAATATRANFYDRVLSQVRGLPGVTNAAYISAVPMSWGGGIWPVGLGGDLLERTADHTASLRYATPGYFATMGIPLHAGRDVRESDTANGQYVVVVSESFVKRYWPDQNPLGRHFTFVFKDRMVVGVVGDVRVRGLERPSEPQVYVPYNQVNDDAFTYYAPKDLVVRATASPTALVPAIRSIVRQIDPQQPVSNVRTLEEIVQSGTASRAVQLRVLGAFALIAVILAGIGIHGLLSFTVSQRTPEIGVRMALGAQRIDILRIVVRRSALLAVAGLIPGIGLAYAAGRALRGVLAGVPPADPITFAGAIALTVAMVMVGTLIPTVRAVSVDVIRAIRAE
jgi:predicted permease